MPTACPWEPRQSQEEYRFDEGGRDTPGHGVQFSLERLERLDVARWERLCS